MNALQQNLCRLIAAAALAATVLSSTAEEPPVAYIVAPAHGEIVSSPVTVVFGLQGMGVSPAGIERSGTGHHHLLVDRAELPPLDQPLGGDVIHFGGGQTQTTIELEPGEHTLQLILGDHLHRPHQPPVISEKITIMVKPATINKLDIKNLKQVSPAVYRSGQPSPQQLEELAAAGIKHIINLRPNSELSWDEAQQVAALGMHYHHLPIASATDINLANAAALAALLDNTDSQPTLVHCASSNRVGALIGLQRANQGLPTEEAIAEGQRWGLTRLEAHLRTVIDDCQQC